MLQPLSKNLEDLCALTASKCRNTNFFLFYFTPMSHMTSKHTTYFNPLPQLPSPARIHITKASKMPQRFKLSKQKISPIKYNAFLHSILRALSKVYSEASERRSTTYIPKNLHSSVKPVECFQRTLTFFIFSPKSEFWTGIYGCYW